MKPVEIVDEAMLLLTFSDIIIVNTSDIHYKFWTFHINHDGSSIISYGRIGKTYQQIEKKYVSEQLAMYDLKKKMMKKLSEGYRFLREE